jgi:hypothetical protein
MMVPSVDFFGSRTSSPFHFKPFSLVRYQLRANDRLYPPDPQDMDFAGGEAVEMYRQLFDSLAGSSHVCSLSYNQFLNGYTFIVTDLSPDASGSAGQISCCCCCVRLTIHIPICIVSYAALAFECVQTVQMVSAHVQPIEEGALSVEMKFKDAIPLATQGLKLLFYMEWDDVFYCDSRRHFIPANLS